MSDALSVCWSEYARFQGFADEQRLNRKCWGVDEALKELLSKVETCSPSALTEWLSGLAHDRSLRLGRPVEPEEALRAWMKNLATNRAKKFRMGVPLESTTLPCMVQNPSVIAERADEVDVVRTNSTDIEWRALWRIACGDGYECIAQGLQMKVNSLKSLVLRCRRRLAQCLGIAI